jgi:hypothetical protein
MKVVRDTRSAWPLRATGDLPVMGIYPWNSVAPGPLRWRSASCGTSIARKLPKNTILALRERRHSFAIEALPKSEKSRRVRTYICACSASGRSG